MKQKIEIGKLVVVSVFVIVTTIVISGGTWLFIELSERNIANTNSVLIGSMEGQIEQLREAVKAKQVFEKTNQVLGSSTEVTE